MAAQEGILWKEYTTKGDSGKKNAHHVQHWASKSLTQVGEKEKDNEQPRRQPAKLEESSDFSQQ